MSMRRPKAAMTNSLSSSMLTFVAVDPSTSRDPPEVDVLLPVYNAEAFLAASLDSLLAQRGVRLRVMLIDDGSTDRSSEIANAYAAGDERIQVISRSNGGIVDALNEGLSLCRAEFVARHDADDIAYPDRLRAQIDFLRQHADVCAVGAMAAHIDGSGKLMGSYGSSDNLSDADFTCAPVREPYILHPLLMVRREALTGIGGYRYVINAEDADLFWRLIETGKLGHIPEVLAAYRIHSSSIMSASVQNGRLAAAHSELAGLSARRRHLGQPDLTFASPRESSLVLASSLQEMIARASEVLLTHEAAFLRISAGAKLMRLAQFRPFELELSDCSYIAQCLRSREAGISSSNWAQIEQLTCETMLRLAKRGRFREALALLTPKMLRLAAPLLLTKAANRLLDKGARSGR